MPADEGVEEQGSLSVEDQRFAIVPEWMIDAPLSDGAFRLYAILLRYGSTSGCRMPGRKTLARHLGGKSVDTVDRVMRELESYGAVVVERRMDGAKHLTNRYHVRTTAPGRTVAATPEEASDGGRTRAATPGRAEAATSGRNGAAGVAADVRPDREFPTESTLTDPDAALHARCAAARRDAGLGMRGWSRAGVARAAERARARGWRAERLEGALLAVAADPATISPLRVAEDGPWWDPPSTQALPAEVADPEQVAGWERALDALDGGRVELQREARRQLTTEGRLLNRVAVLRRAVELLQRSGDDAGCSRTTRTPGAARDRSAGNQPAARAARSAEDPVDAGAVGAPAPPGPSGPGIEVDDGPPAPAEPGADLPPAPAESARTRADDSWFVVQADPRSAAAPVAVLSRHRSERAALAALCKARNRGSLQEELQVRTPEQITARLEWDTALGKPVTRPGPPPSTDGRVT